MRRVFEASKTSELTPRPLVQYSPERGKLNAELGKFLYENLYDNPAVNEPHIRARQVLEDLFKHYLRASPEIGTRARKRARRDGWPRAVCDYLAGMTDRYALLRNTSGSSRPAGSLLHLRHQDQFPVADPDLLQMIEGDGSPRIAAQIRGEVLRTDFVHIHRREVACP